MNHELLREIRAFLFENEDRWPMTDSVKNELLRLQIAINDELFLKREYSAAMVENTYFEKWLSETEMQSPYVKNSLRQAYWAGYHENSIAQGLAVMIIRLVRRVRKISPDDDISIIAMDYLKRIGLPIGTPLRDI